MARTRSRSIDRPKVESKIGKDTLVHFFHKSGQIDEKITPEKWNTGGRDFAVAEMDRSVRADFLKYKNDNPGDTRSDDEIIVDIKNYPHHKKAQEMFERFDQLLEISTSADKNITEGPRRYLANLMKAPIATSQVGFTFRDFMYVAYGRKPIMRHFGWVRVPILSKLFFKGTKLSIGARDRREFIQPTSQQRMDDDLEQKYKNTEKAKIFKPEEMFEGADSLVAEAENIQKLLSLIKNTTNAPGQTSVAYYGTLRDLVDELLETVKYKPATKSTNFDHFERYLMEQGDGYAGLLGKFNNTTTNYKGFFEKCDSFRTQSSSAGKNINVVINDFKRDAIGGGASYGLNYTKTGGICESVLKSTDVIEDFKITAKESFLAVVKILVQDPLISTLDQGGSDNDKLRRLTDSQVSLKSLYRSLQLNGGVEIGNIIKLDGSALDHEGRTVRPVDQLITAIREGTLDGLFDPKNLAQSRAGAILEIMKIVYPEKSPESTPEQPNNKSKSKNWLLNIKKRYIIGALLLFSNPIFNFGRDLLRNFIQATPDQIAQVADAGRVSKGAETIGDSDGVYNSTSDPETKSVVNKNIKILSNQLDELKDPSITQNLITAKVQAIISGNDPKSMTTKDLVEEILARTGRQKDAEFKSKLNVSVRLVAVSARLKQ